MNTFKLAPRTLLDEETTDNQILKLFPRRSISTRRIPTVDRREVPLFTMEELQQTVRKLKKQKSASTGRHTLEMLKAIIEEHPEEILDVMNKCIIDGKFSKESRPLSTIRKRRQGRLGRKIIPPDLFVRCVRKYD